MKLDGMHHITMITGDATAERRVLRRRARPADGQEDRELRCARGVSPVLRRRAGLTGIDPDLVRVRRRAPRPGRGGNDPHDPARRGVRGVAGVLGRPPRRQGLRQRARRAVAVLHGLRRPAPRARGRRRRQPAAARRAPRGAGRARDPRRRGRPGLHRSGHRRRPRPADRDARVHRGSPTASTASTATRATSTGATTPPPSAGSRAPAPSTTSPGTRATRTMSRWQERVAQAGMHVTPVIDRDYFFSIYFRQPQGILFEIATTLARLRRRRGSRPPRRGAAPAQAARAPAPAAGAPPDPADQPARRRAPGGIER